MKCVHIYSREKNEEQTMTKSVSVHSNASTSMSMSTDCYVQRLGQSSIPRISLISAHNHPQRIHFHWFTFSELKTATKNFNRALMIREGGFGAVYRVVIRSQDQSKKMDIAVKQPSRRGLQGHKEWVTEVNVLGVVEHPNLVKLMGYRAEDDERGIQRLLIYEYMLNKRVQDHLFNRLRSPLPWTTRMKVAQEAARGLAYLHEGMDFERLQIFQHTFDDKWNAKLSDFGLAKLGPSDGLSHIKFELIDELAYVLLKQVVGTIGYTAPEYLVTGHLTSRSDVWAYGVFPYELITGRRPLDRNRPKNEQKLLEWVRLYLTDAKKFSLIWDPRLEGKYNLKSAQKLAAIANRYLARQAKACPKMSEVLELVNKIMNATENGKRALPMKDSQIPKMLLTSKREYLKRMFMKPLVGENRCLPRRTWRPNVIRTC
ncbi:hypothetical protein K2173_011698 [Erythroxylum novogranatense]|uniref:Protein kinase domain-containing protein n=1 Tax=Erythroxylum novogranatense TaxID=1862640 RepID=A0AAV8T0K8_9ROSI|nr:hypothetical protein K2173_011698 [Erythroxylum novogranatense]